LLIPNSIEGVDAKVLDPRNTYESADEWQVKAKDLAGQFINNFVKFTDVQNGASLVKVGPQLEHC
jgi:phosphoenolpyruvate carboxykinase (ATP)